MYSLTNILRVIKSGRIGWDGNVACIGERRGVYVFWWGNLRERDRVEYQDVDWK